MTTAVKKTRNYAANLSKMWIQERRPTVPVPDTVYAALVFVYRQLTWVLYTGIEFTYNYIIKRQGFPYGYFVRHPAATEVQLGRARAGAVSAPTRRTSK